jgi:hypothetical protein
LREGEARVSPFKSPPETGTYWIRSIDRAKGDKSVPFRGKIFDVNFSEESCLGGEIPPLN